MGSCALCFRRFFGGPVLVEGVACFPKHRLPYMVLRDAVLLFGQDSPLLQGLSLYSGVGSFQDAAYSFELFDCHDFGGMLVYIPMGEILEIILLVVFAWMMVEIVRESFKKSND